MTEHYCTVHQLIHQYCKAMIKGNIDSPDTTFINKCLKTYTTTRENKYYIVCSFTIKRTGYGEVIYISYDDELEPLLTLADSLCTDQSLDGIHIGIFELNVGMLCESSPIGMIYK